MLQNRARGIHALLLVCQCVLVSAVYWVWLPVSQHLLTDAYEDLWELDLKHYAWYNVLILIGIAVGWATERCTANLFRPTFKSATENAGWSLLFGGGVLFVFLVATQDNTISRAFLLGLLPLCYATLAWSNRYLPGWLAGRNFRGPYEHRVIVMGGGDENATLIPWLLQRSDSGMRIMGEVSADEGPTSLRRLGNPADLERVIVEHGITQVVVSALPRRDEPLHHAMEVCERLGVRLLVRLDLESRFRHPVKFFEEGELRFIGLRKEPLEDPFNRFVKRSLDVVIALPVVLVILPPVTVVVWLLQRWQSPGPVFHRQKRSGIRSQPFLMLKFRTMHANHGAEARQATRDDERIYQSGRWLRRLSIDELPQFWNVLFGDMSIVGPRPHLPQHDDLFARAMKNYFVRAAVKPGITGLAQVRGFRGATITEDDVANRIRSDIDYLENWSLELDVSIIVRTFWHMLFPPSSAY